jgi:succinate dehydrogenase / fumarate reductase, cytochrome b subunit
MDWLSRFLTSHIGLKIVMALTGMMLVGFVIFHMVGNLQVFLGAESLNHYAEMLGTWPEAKWMARIGLLGAVGAHMASAIALTRRSAGARPQAYGKYQWLNERYAVRTMRLGGLVLFLFIIYHLLHLTAGTVHPSFREGDVYSNVISGFRVWWVSLFYMVAQVFLGLHLAHGVWSMFRTLGLATARWDTLLRRASIGVGAMVAIGNCSIPLAILFRVIG